MADNVIVRVPEQQFIRGEDGFDPVVTVEDIEHGHRVTITDREHPVEGQSFDVMDGASAYEQAVAGGYTGTEEEFAEDLAGFSEKAQATTNAAAAAAQSAQNAADSATAATTKAQEAAESAATALTRMNSANSSAQAAADSATSADNSANAAASSASAANDSAASASASESNAANSATNAAASETAAAASESAAAASATAAGNSAAAAAQSASAIGEYEHDAEAWAIGKRGGTDVESTDETYHNNSKYYAVQAAADASTASSAASAASQSEQNAAASATSASQSETNAAASETAAAGSASTATTEATDASNSATAAANSATAAGDAKTAAEIAQGKAEDAQEAAEQAQSDAETAAQSVSQSAAQITQNASDISDLKSAIDELETDLFGRAIDIILTRGTKVDPSGEIVPDDNYFCSGIIAVPTGTKKVIVTYAGVNNPNTVAFYDDNQAYIGMTAGVKDPNSNDRIITLSNVYKEIRYIAVFVNRLTVKSAMFVMPNVSEQAFYRVNTDDIRTVNIDYESTGGSSGGYGAITKAPTDLTEKFAISNIMSVKAGLSAIQSKYPAINPHTFADAPIITSKYCIIGFIVRSKYDFTLDASTIAAYNSSGSVVGNIIESVRIKKKKLSWLDDATAITLYVEFKPAFTDGTYKLRNNISISFVTGSDAYSDFLTYYNGYQVFYYRYALSDTDTLKFDFSTSILTNSYWLNKFDTIYKFKKICLYGTSIEKKNYIAVTGKRLRLYENVGYFNYGNGGGGIVFDPTVTALPVDIDRLKKCFSCTVAEKESALTAAGYDPSTIPADDLNTSYDVCLLQNLDADLFIIGTYGINDRTYEDAFVVSEERAMDRTTIYGAYNYVLDKLYTAKPTAKVIILGQHLFTWENTEEVNEIQQKVAARWGIPFADWGHKMSINSITKSTYTSDGVHPNTAGRERLGNFLYEYLTKDYCIC